MRQRIAFRYISDDAIRTVDKTYVVNYTTPMNTVRLSATAARNNFFELLNQVALGTQVIIEKDNKEVAIISSKTTKFNWKEFKRALDATHGILKDYKWEDGPLRKPGNADFLGKWDKNI